MAVCVLHISVTMKQNSPTYKGKDSPQTFRLSLFISFVLPALACFVSPSVTKNEKFSYIDTRSHRNCLMNRKSDVWGIQGRRCDRTMTSLTPSTPSRRPKVVPWHGKAQNNRYEIGLCCLCQDLYAPIMKAATRFVIRHDIKFISILTQSLFVKAELFGRRNNV
jgi:hypothetical protein